MLNLNVFINNFLGCIQTARDAPWLRWLFQLLAISYAISPVGWPASYPLKGMSICIKVADPYFIYNIFIK